MGLEERIQQRTIDGTTYEVTPLTFGVGHKALLRFIKIAGPLLSAALEGKEGGYENAAASIFKVLPAVLTEEDIAYFSREFGLRTRYQDGSKWVPLVAENQEIHFAGRYSAFFGWMRFCIEVNFGGFFGDLMRQGSAAVSLQGETKAA